jgi:speckle-type POZ protein
VLEGPWGKWIPPLKSCEFSSEDNPRNKWHLALCEDGPDASTNGFTDLKVVLNLCNNINNNCVKLAEVRVKIAILNKKREKIFLQTHRLPLETRTPFTVLQINKKSLIASDCFQSDGSFTIYCQIGNWALKGIKTGKSTDKLTRDVPTNPFSSSDLQLRTQLEELFNNKTFSDVTLNVGGRSFDAHKAILSSRSKVFAAMFVHETTEKLSNHVDIQDIHPDVFQEVLRFIYTGRVPPEKMTASLLAAADKYLLEQLKLECETQLTHRMSAGNCLELLALVDPHHPAQHLRKFAVDFLRRFPYEVMTTDEWKKAKEENAVWMREFEQQRHPAY